MKNDTSEFKNIGAAWRQERNGKTFYSVKFDQDVFEGNWDDLVANGCLMMKNKFKKNDNQPDLLLRARIDN